MRINSFRFYFAEASRNVFRNGWMGVASVITIFFCLVMFGACFAISENVKYNLEIVESQYDIPVSVSREFTVEQLDAMAKTISEYEGVKETSIVTKEEGLEIMREELKGYEGLTDGLDEYNPLPHIIKVNLTDLTYADAVIEKIRFLDGVEGINARFELREQLTKIANVISKVTFYIMLFLMIIAVFIIANTIRIAVFSRRKEINIMKFVGATDWFIRWPFVIEGIIIGLVGCAISYLVVSGLYLYIQSNAVKLGVFELMGFSGLWLPLLIAFIVLSVGLGSVGSFISIRKHLKV